MNNDKEKNIVNSEVDVLVANGMEALGEYSDYNQEQIDHIVAKACVAALDQHGQLALAAIEETKRGVFEDKAIKNLYACEYIMDEIKHLKTVGLIDNDEVLGIQSYAEPLGVICGVTPTTNPTSTTIFKSLISLKTRNPIIFAFHPSAQQCSIQAAAIIKEAAIAAGAPENCIQWIEKPSLGATNDLMNHADVASILATGGNAMVKAAYSCGKPALGVGAGNVPAFIEKSANIKQAVNDIVLSKTFDNGMICASEQAVIIDKGLYTNVIKLFKEHLVYFVNEKEKAALEKMMFGVDMSIHDGNSAKLNTSVVGMSPYWIAQQAGFSVPEDTSILAVECREVGIIEPLTGEKLSPVLAVLKANDSNHGISLARQMVEFHGLGHSAVIHSYDGVVIDKFAREVKAIRLINNAPSSHGGIGGIYNSFMSSLTLGCGSYGANSISNNVGAMNLLNIKRVGRRNNHMQWFKVPPKIYFERNSINYLGQMSGVSRVMIVTDKAMCELGLVNKIEQILRSRSNSVVIEVFSDVEPDPSLDTVKAGAKRMENFKPDTIIALGGGSPMDAAKVMWLLYEAPQTDFDDLKQKFMDMRKRAIAYPKLGNKSQMVCIPTTSGTGSEVTPFAVITDTVSKKKYPLADYQLTPDVAIIDAQLTKTLPSFIAADTGMDVLTHAIEAYVSVLANDFTDGLAIKAIQLVFDNLERSVKFGEKDLEAQEKMHNAGTIAGMAFANAFLGINHSLAHKIGGIFHVPHGRANSILLPHVIKYNGKKSGKPATWPKYTHYQADIKYYEIARAIGLNPKTPEQGVEQFANAVSELAAKINMVATFKECNITKEEYLANIDFIALNAYEDQCSTANPKQPLVKDLKQILLDAFE